MTKSFLDKDFIACFLSCLLLIKKLPMSKQLWSHLSECCERIGFIQSIKRSLVIGMHLRPLDSKLYDLLIRNVEVYHPSQADEIKWKKLFFFKNDFDLIFHFFKKDAMTVFPLVLSSIHEPKHIRLIVDELNRIDGQDMILDTLKIGVEKFPTEFYLPLSEYYAKHSNFFLAWKSTLYFSYHTHNDAYVLAGNYLEKSNHLVHSVFCFYQAYLSSRNKDILEHIEKLIKRVNSKRFILSNDQVK